MYKIICKKHIFFIILYVFTVTGLAFAQKGKAYDMTIGGVKVIVQPSGNEIVEIQTIIKGGVQNYPANKAGIENLAFTALTECGTARDDKNSFKNKLDKVSAEVGGSTGMDLASFRMNCIRSDFDVVWPLYVDALTTPLFDEKEFERIRQDAINALRAQASQPDYALSQYARQVAWAGKDYAKNPAGTEETVKSLRVVEVKAYYKSLLTKSRMVIVVVADLDRATLEKKIGTMLSAIPDGKPFQLKKQTYSPKQNTFVSEKKDYATNYIQGVTGAPLPGSTEYNAFMIAMRIFRDRNFLEVRTNNGLSYAPRTLFDDGVSPTANIMVSTTNPNKYVGVVQSLISKIKKEGFTPDEIKNMKSTYITRFYYNQETNNAQAGSLATYEVLHNDWHKALNMNEDLKKVNVADVNNVFNKYVTNLTWVYQGNPEQADVKLFTGAMTQQKLPPSKVKSKVNN